MIIPMSISIDITASTNNNLGKQKIDTVKGTIFWALTKYGTLSKTSGRLYKI